MERLQRLLHGERFQLVWDDEPGAPPGAVMLPTRTMYVSSEPLRDLSPGEPIPDDLVDVIAAIVMHESGHVALKPPCPPARTPLGRLVDSVLSDVEVDATVARKHEVLGEYIREGRRFFAADVARFMAERLSDHRLLGPGDICMLWAYRELYALDVSRWLVGRRERTEAMRAIGRLGRVAVRAANGDGRERRGYLSLRRAALRILGQYAKAVGYNADDAGSVSLALCTRHAESKASPSNQADLYLPPGSRSQDISADADAPTQLVTPPPERRSQRVARSATVISDALEVRGGRTITLHHQECGDLDDAHLWRTGVGDSDVFRAYECEDALPLTLMVLLDVSGSMREEGRWETARDSVRALVDGLPAVADLDLIVWCYCTGALWRAFEPGWQNSRMSGIFPQGDTPTERALRLFVERTAAMRSDKPRVLLHLTDGMPNDGSSPEGVAAQVEEIETRGIAVVGVGVNVDARVMRAQYRRSTVISTSGDLPRALRSLLLSL
jgi:Mg-chelatase subunit ChlD